MKVKDYKDLKVWMKGIEIVDLVYQLTSLFPSTERFVLASQMQKSAISIPSNIAEGFSRQHTKEYKQFLFVVLGSCSELSTQAILAQRRNYIQNEKCTFLSEQLDFESRMIMNLIKSLSI